MSGDEERHYWFQRHPRLTLLVAALAGCLVICVGAELVARTISTWWAPTREERAKFWRYDPLLGWSHIPLQRGVLNHKDFSVKVEVSSEGLRDAEYPRERGDKKRMLVLGDSFAWGLGVAQEDRFSEILERKHGEWEIINAGVSGYSTDQEFLYLRERGMLFHPDVVLLLFYQNDFDGNCSGEDNWYFKPYFVLMDGALVLRNNPVPRATLRQRTDRFFFGRTYLLRFAYGAVVRIAGALRSRLGPPAGEQPVREGAPRPDSSVTRYLLRGMNAICRESGARFVLVGVPMETSRGQLLQEYASAEGIPCLLLDPFFEGNEARTSFSHDRHWNAEGHKVAAFAMDDFLARLGVF